jgi:amylosucrase
MTATKAELSPEDLRFEADKTLRRLLPRVEPCLRAHVGDDGWEAFQRRATHYWEPLFGKLYQLYGGNYEFFYHLEQLMHTLAEAVIDRPAAMRELDARREVDPLWYESQQMVGGALYVDLFTENLNTLREHIPYFKDLGLTYLHLMPLFAVPDGPSDGGYAISDYRSVKPELGTIEDLRELAHDLQNAGIALTLDFVFNHTADDHQWAKQAQSGNREFQEYYYIFKDRHLPDQYERTLREIFPTVRRGNFTWHDGMRGWVWTTFNSYQWDLNYRNPAVFRAMLAEMCYLANVGVEILRLDAVAFIWKEMGTVCENLPEAHTIIEAYNLCCRIAVPGLVFKSEAIVHPDEVIKYIGPDECQLSYNPTLMALLWETLATRETKLVEQSIRHRHALPEGSAWCNYLRCHDDIGWSFDNADAWRVGINPEHHRDFLNAFYTGRFPGSFARGVPFQYNESTGDMRISGTLASLAGLEQALESGHEEWKEMALGRIQLLYGVICSVGGIPLIYLGEEWGMLNDYAYTEDPRKAHDSRWIHRPRMDWEFLEELKDPDSVRTRIFRGLQTIIQARKEQEALFGNTMWVLPTHNAHVLGYVRQHEGNYLIVLANFSERHHEIAGACIRHEGLGHWFKDVLSAQEVGTRANVLLKPYQLMWLVTD